MARLPSVSPDDVPDEWRHVFLTYRELDDDAPAAYVPPIAGADDVDRDLQGERPPIYGVLGNNPPVLDVFRRTLGELRRTSGLSDRHRELVILALARELDCEYMWHRHVTVALAGPLSRDDVLAVADGGFASFDDADRAVLRYAVAFARQAVDDDRHRQVVEALDPASVVGLAMFAGCYLGMMMYVIDALDVEPADAFVGWDLSNLPPGAG